MIWKAENTLSSQARGVLNFCNSEANSKFSSQNRAGHLFLLPVMVMTSLLPCCWYSSPRSRRLLFAGGVYKPISDKLQQWCWPWGIESLNSFTGIAGIAPGGEGLVEKWSILLCEWVEARTLRAEGLLQQEGRRKEISLRTWFWVLALPFIHYAVLGSYFAISNILTCFCT